MNQKLENTENRNRPETTENRNRQIPIIVEFSTFFSKNLIKQKEKLSQATEALKKVLSGLTGHLWNTPPYKRKTHILFRYTGNIHQDRPYANS